MAEKKKGKIDINIKDSAEDLKNAAEEIVENIMDDNINDSEQTMDDATNNSDSSESVDNETVTEENSEKDGIFNRLKNKIKGEPKVEELSELDKLKLAKTEVDDKYVRLYAEFDNFRRRTAKEKLEVMKTAGRDIIADLLSVLDDFDRAKKAIDEAKAKKQDPDYSGYDLIQNKINNLLTGRGLKEMETNGEVFNADLHEALTEIPAATEDLKGKIIDTIEKGYTLNEVIIRHPKVVIGK